MDACSDDISTLKRSHHQAIMATALIGQRRARDRACALKLIVRGENGMLAFVEVEVAGSGRTSLATSATV